MLLKKAWKSVKMETTVTWKAMMMTTMTRTVVATATANKLKKVVFLFEINTFLNGINKQRFGFFSIIGEI